MMIRNVTVYSLIFDNSKLQDMAYQIHYVGLIEITVSLLIVLKGPLKVIKMPFKLRGVNTISF